MIVTLPTLQSNFLALTIDSSDGQYHAELTYAVPPNASGRYHLSFPTSHKEDLERYRPEQLGILACSGKQCGNTSALILPVAWSAESSNQGKVTLQVNSGGDDIDSRVYSPALDRYFPCHRLSQTPLISFNTICNIASSRPHTAETFVLLRSEFQNSLPEISISMYNP
jgi:hypothetical protein